MKGGLFLASLKAVSNKPTFNLNICIWTLKSGQNGSFQINRVHLSLDVACLALQSYWFWLSITCLIYSIIICTILGRLHKNFSMCRPTFSCEEGATYFREIDGNIFHSVLCRVLRFGSFRDIQPLNIPPEYMSLGFSKSSAHIFSTTLF